MIAEEIYLLLIEDQEGDARLIREYLKGERDYSFVTTWKSSLKDGINYLKGNRVDIILLDMGLPDSQGVKTLQTMLSAAPRKPVIVITGLDDTAVGVQALHQGAQDYVVKGHMDETHLKRSIWYALERKQGVNQRQLINRVLSILNRKNEWQDLLHDILIHVKEFTSVESVGVRIKTDENYPYFVYHGFTRNFIHKENNLCALDATGTPIRSTDGTCRLECLCGAVIRGNLPGSYDWFTPAGSFWTNDLPALVAEGHPAGELPISRSSCLEAGYASLALIPLRSREEIIGLLQLNDTRPGMFTAGQITFFEEIGSTLGIAFQRMESERIIQDRIKELNVLHNLSILSEISADEDEYVSGLLELLLMGFHSPVNPLFRLEVNGKEYLTRQGKPSVVLYRSDIVSGSRNVGFLEVGMEDPRKETATPDLLHEERELMITVAKQIGDFLDRLRSAQVQRVIYNITAFSGQTSEPEELIRYIQAQLATLIDTTNFFMALYDPDTDLVSIPYFTNVREPVPAVAPGKTLTSLVVHTGKPLIANRDELDAMSVSGEIEFLGERAQVWLGVPLKIRERVIGAVVVQSYTDEQAYTLSDMEILEVICSQISISIERQFAEQELRQALEKAKESDRLKSAFLNNISHELRTPLNAVLGFAQIVNTETPKEEILDYLRFIYRGGYHLLEIIEDILHVSLLESGAVEVTKKDHTLQSVLNDVETAIRLEQVRIHKEDLQLVRLQLPPEIEDSRIHTDAEKFKQVMLNLLKNALKFTTEGSIEFGAERVILSGTPWFRFFVRDTGIGIPKEARELIFDLFRQVEETHTRRHGGTGLGLSVSKRLSEMLGGTLTVESEPGKGSTFFFTIPDEIQGEPAHEEPEQPVSLPRRVHGKTVLVAEDEESNFELLNILLTQQQIRVIWAKNGREAVRIHQEIPGINLVLMDLKMPELNGIEATRIIRLTDSSIPIIAQTAYAMPADRQEAFQAGCTGFLTKPLRKDELINILDKYLILR